MATTTAEKDSVISTSPALTDRVDSLYAGLKTAAIQAAKYVVKGVSYITSQFRPTPENIVNTIRAYGGQSEAFEALDKAAQEKLIREAGNTRMAIAYAMAEAYKEQ